MALVQEAGIAFFVITFRTRLLELSSDWFWHIFSDPFPSTEVISILSHELPSSRSRPKACGVQRLLSKNFHTTKSFQSAANAMSQGSRTRWNQNTNCPPMYSWARKCQQLVSVTQTGKEDSSAIIPTFLSGSSGFKLLQVSDDKARVFKLNLGSITWARPKNTSPI